MAGTEGRALDLGQGQDTGSSGNAGVADDDSSVVQGRLGVENVLEQLAGELCVNGNALALYHIVKAHLALYDYEGAYAGLGHILAGTDHFFHARELYGFALEKGCCAHFPEGVAYVLLENDYYDQEERGEYVVQKPAQGVEAELAAYHVDDTQEEKSCQDGKGP